jgi:3-hydroxyisobutyrate dehydrogenase
VCFVVKGFISASSAPFLLKKIARFISFMTSPRIAFLGLGIMGGGMARRLLGAGFPLAIYNRNPERAAALAASGARAALSPRDAVVGADIVISMVADDAASRAVWLGPDGALAGLSRGAVAVECSTLTVAWVRELAWEVAERGGEFIDAPVTGSKDAAATGALNFLVGGGAATLEKIRPALAVMGRSVTHLGPTGSGALVKLVNNFLAGVQVAAFAEALTWLEKSGVARDPAVGFLLEGAAASPITKVVSARMLAGDFSPHFLLRLMTKDLGYALDEAGHQGVALATAEAALGQFRAAIAAGLGDKDMAAIFEGVRRGVR